MKVSDGSSLGSRYKAKGGRLNSIECGITKTLEMMKKIENKKRDTISLGMAKLLSTTEELGTINSAFHPYHDRADLQERVRLQQEKDEEHDEEEKVSTPIQCVRLPCIMSCISNHNVLRL